MFSGTLPILLALCAIGAAVCSAFELGSVAGAVKDAVRGTSMANVEVRVPLWPAFENRRMIMTSMKMSHFKSINDFVYTSTTTNSQGLYELSLPLLTSIATYDVEFNATNYNPATIRGVDVRANEQTIVEELSYIDRSVTGLGTVGGIVKNAQTGAGVGGVVMNIRQGQGVQSGPVFTTVTTSSDGTWRTTLTTGYYTAEFSKFGYVTGFRTLVSIGGQPTVNQNIALTVTVRVGETRIVLTWGATPYDLDSHLTGPLSTGGRFHVYYGSKGSKVISPFSDLDIDDTSSYGPETVTVTRQEDGVYRYSVRDFSNGGSTQSMALAHSGAKVEVTHAGFTRTFFVPPGRYGTLWTVFELRGNDITPVNVMSYHTWSSSVP